MNGWWIALSAIGGILLLLFSVLFFGTVSVRIVYQDKPVVWLSVFGIRKLLFKKGAKKTELTDIATSPNPNRLWKKEQKRLRKAAKKEERKRLKQQKKKAREPALKKDEPTPNLKESIDMILAVLKRAYALTKGKLRLDFNKLHVRVATDNAASTAVLYGITVQSAAYLLQWCQDHFNDIHRKEGDLAVDADFLSVHPSIEADLRLRVRIFRAIGIAIGLSRSYHTEKEKARKRAKERAIKSAEKKRKTERNRKAW